MNNQGRKQIDALIANFKDAFADIATDIDDIRNEEQEKFDNLSEGLQASEKGQTLEATIEALGEAYDAAEAVQEIEFVVDTDEIITALDQAKYAG